MRGKYRKKLMIVIGIFIIIIPIMILLANILQSPIPYTLIMITILPLGCYLLCRIIIPYTDEKYQVEQGNELLLISQQSIIPRVGISNHKFMFDQNYFCDISSEKTIKIPLKNIIQISKTNLAANNRKAWIVICVLEDNTKYSFCFLHNYSLRNKNFLAFLSLVKLESPLCKIDKFNFLTM